MSQPNPSAPQITGTQLTHWVHKMAEKYGMEEGQFQAGCEERYGSVKKAMDALEANFAFERESIKQAFPPGQPRIEVGRKPAPGDQVVFAPLGDGITVRIWDGDLAPYSCFSFDFVDKDGQYILTPADIKIFSIATASCPGGPVYSIEKCLKLDDPHNRPGSLRNSRDMSQFDPNWETYVIPDGTILCFKRPNQQDHFVHIPMRHPHGVTVTLQTSQ